LGGGTATGLQPEERDKATVKTLSTAIATIALLWAAAASAGPLDSPVLDNPCAMPIDDFKLALVANESGTDLGGSACGSGGGCAETMIVCTNVGDNDDGPMDLGVELFTSTGLPIAGFFMAGNSVRCGLAPGASVAFVSSGTMELPYIGQPLVGGPQVPLGSLRIMSTSPKTVACDVTLIDRSNVMVAGSTTMTKGVTVTRASKPQKGD
jgi:hypothetical protein